MNVKELWSKACELLQKEINSVTYTTFIEKNLTAVGYEDDAVYLVAAIVNMIPLVTGTYGTQIESCLSAVTGKKTSIVILSQKEWDEHCAKKNGAAEEQQFNPNYTFDSFVVGSNNKFAHAACLAVADAPAKAFNPLFIYGGVGLGKTHLMHAIGHRMLEQDPDKKILYITSENFTTELIEAIRTQTNNEFRYRFRNVDVLMMDDIQFIAGRDTTQEEFFHTFNALHSVGKQIILTSDRPPQDIAKLEERLTSRFSWGLIADISKPDLDTRVAILKSKADKDHIEISDKVLEMIANHADHNIRELEGCLTKLVAYANLSHRPITEDLCREALREVIEQRKRKVITIDSIKETVCDYYGITVEELDSPSRRREIAIPRQITMYLACSMTSMSSVQIGSAIGDRDHTTVLHAIGQVKKNIQDNESFATTINDLKNLINDQ